jgi:hypothetical protein
LDPTNPFVAPFTVPFVIALSYGACIWGFADVTIGLNTARDLGCRIVAAIFFGKEAFTFRNYAWIPILTNIFAFILMTGLYELVYRDSLQKIHKGHAQHEDGEEGLRRHLTRTGTLENGVTNSVGYKESPVND